MSFKGQHVTSKRCIEKQLTWQYDPLKVCKQCPSLFYLLTSLSPLLPDNHLHLPCSGTHGWEVGGGKGKGDPGLGLSVQFRNNSEYIWELVNIWSSYVCARPLCTTGRWKWPIEQRGKDYGGHYWESGGDLSKSNMRFTHWFPRCSFWESHWVL